MIAFDAFERYAHALVQSLDADPVYHLVPKIVELEGFEAEWFVFVYVAFYSLESAIEFCRRFPTAASYRFQDHIEWVEAPRRFGVERRGTSRVVHLMAEAFDAFACPGALEKLRATLPTLDQTSCRTALSRLPLVGDWAAFKLTELFEKAMGLKNLAPTDMGLFGRDPNSTRGPQGGCRLLYTSDPNLKFPKSILSEWEALGVELAMRWGYDLGAVETCLCKWAKIIKGQYFIGHDIYEFTHLRRLWSLPVYSRLMLKSGFDPRFWAEKLDVPKLKRMYRTRRILLNDDFATRGVVPRKALP